MEPINYFLALIVAFSGLIAGIFLAFFAKEEIEPGRLYLALLQKALFIVIAAIFINFMEVSLFLRLITYFLLLAFLIQKNSKSEILYPLLSVMFFLVSKNNNTFLLISGLTFLFGLPSGSLAVKDFNKKLKEVSRIIPRNMSFILIGAVLFLVYWI